jgi:hypothetical protein
MFFSADLSLAAGKIPAAFGIILQNHRRLPVSIFSVKIAALGSLKQVTGRFSKLVSTVISKEQAKTFSLIFSLK